MGPKGENVEKPLVFAYFFEGQRSEEESKTANNYPAPTGFDSRKSVIFDSECFMPPSRIVLLVQAGSTFSENK